MGKATVVFFSIVLASSLSEANICKFALFNLAGLISSPQVTEEEPVPETNRAMNTIEFTAGSNLRVSLVRNNGFFKDHDSILQATRDYVPLSKEVYELSTTLSVLNSLYYDVLLELPVIANRDFWGAEVVRDSAIPMSIFALIEALKFRIPRDRIRTAWMIHTPEGTIERSVRMSLIIKGIEDEWYAMDPNVGELLTLTDWYEYQREGLGVEKDQINADSKRLAFAIWEAGYTSFIGGVELPKSVQYLFAPGDPTPIENPESHLHPYYRDYFSTQPAALQWTHGGHGGIIQTPRYAYPRSPERLVDSP